MHTIFTHLCADSNRAVLNLHYQRNTILFNMCEAVTSLPHLHDTVYCFQANFRGFFAALKAYSATYIHAMALTHCNTTGSSESTPAVG
jgi:hypothetical protein